MSRWSVRLPDHDGQAMSDPAGTTLERLATLGAGTAGLRLLVLFGSRARTDAREGSDWDLGYLAGPGFDPQAFVGELAGVLGTDRIDLADLGRAGAQLRYRAAAEGRVVFAADPAAFPRFWLDAVGFWCDARAIIEPGYRETLRSLRA
jgi:hypothetical protein